MLTAIRYVLYTFPLVVILIAVSMLWVDRPVALSMAEHYQVHSRLGSAHWAILLTQLTYCLMLLCFAWYFVLRVNNHQSKFVPALGLFNMSIAVAYFIKMTLQFVFGRYMPRYPEKATLLFVHNPKLYGFHWFHSGSLPSGHMTLLTAGAVAISLYYPRFKYVATLLALILGGALLIFNYHFVSDLIAGAYLGTSVALALHFLSKR